MEQGIQHLTLKQVAEQLQLGRKAIYRLIDMEGLPAVHFGRAVRVRVDAFNEWLRAREAQEQGVAWQGDAAKAKVAFTSVRATDVGSARSASEPTGAKPASRSTGKREKR